MIKQRRGSVQVDQRGKVKSGKKNEKGFPVGLDHFRIDAFPDLIELYGEKPSSLLVMPPTDNVGDFFDDKFEAYGGKPGKDATKIRECDGEKCLHRIDENILGNQFGAGEITDCICERLRLLENEDKKVRDRACRYSAYAKFFVANPNTGKLDNPLCILFETHSQNSGANLHNALQNMAGLTSILTGGTPKLQFLPFRLTVKIVQSKTDARLRFPIWELSPVGNVLAIQKRLVSLSKVLGWSDEIQQRLLSSGESIIQNDGNIVASSAKGPALPAIEQNSAASVVEELFPDRDPKDDPIDFEPS